MGQQLVTHSTQTSRVCSPRFATAPDPTCAHYGRAVAGVAQLLGFLFLPWQQLAARLITETTQNGRPRHRLVVIIVPRRAGKTVLVLALTVMRLLGYADHRAAYLAQTRSDGADVWRDEWWPAIRDSQLASRLAIRESNGSEMITTVGRARPSRARLLAPTEKVGHSKAIDDAVIDEAWAHTLERGTQIEGGLRPTQATRPRAQLIVISAAGNAESTYLMSYRDAGRAAADGVAYLEFSAPEDADRDDPATWYAAHPALGHTIDEAFLSTERATMDRAEFDRAYLGVWPAAARARAIDPAIWAAALDPASQPGPERVFAFDVTPDRSAGSIAVAAPRHDGRIHVELVDHRDGVTWILPRLLELYHRHGRPQLVADGGGPAGSIAVDLQRRRLRLELLAASGYTDTCETFTDLLNAGRLAHIGQPPLDHAVDAAVKRTLGESWAWTRRSTAADISPLVAVTLAAGLAVRPRPKPRLYIPS